jgi:hypothetical protein
MCEQVGPVRRDLDRAVQVGPKHLRSGALEAGEGFRCRVAVVVGRADADDRDPRSERLDQRRAGGRAAAMVGDLEHVEPWADARREPGREQLRVGLFFNVAQEDHVARPEVELQHDRRAVDLLA